MPDLLIELFSEEIPARMQPKARADLKKLVTDGLVEAGLTYAGAGAFSTPRRLALSVEGLDAASKPVREERKGPRADAPEKALEGFLRSTGLTKDQLELRDEKKGQVYFAVIERPGRPAAEIVAEVLEKTIRDFPWPKSMRWGSGTLRWVRPLHSILCILSDEAGAEVVPLEVDGIVSGDTTRGHRFMAPDAFSVTNFEDYAAKLRRAKVMLDTGEREAAIEQEAANLAFARGLEIVEDTGLLAEVAGLVEWPVPLMGAIEARFLTLPPEVLQTSMKEHQKFFSARNPKTGRIEGFVTVANIEATDDGETILAGNQRVLAARLSDGLFFWENDLREAKAGMTDWAEGLKSVTFHNKLGSQADRVARIAALAREIAPMVGADPDQAARAAELAKLDLRSSMVGEFPELQGVMGRYYALEAGEPEAVADAARDHYSPLGPSDDVPTAPVSVAVALADKIDTLTGFWAIDEKPTGSKDPFALRRAALGVIRLVLQNNLKLELQRITSASLVIKASADSFKDTVAYQEALGQRSSTYAKRVEKAVRRILTGDFDPNITQTNDWEKTIASQQEDPSTRVDEMLFYMVVQRHLEINGSAIDLLSFLHDRLKVYLRDQGIRHDIIDAVLAQPGNDDLVLVVNRAKALNDMLATEDGQNLTQGLKRAGNILGQAEEKDGVEYSFGADPKFAETDAERALFAALDSAEPAIKAATASEDFPAAMSAIAGLRAPIDAFFEAVQVNTDNQIVRRNRLNLLSRIREAGRQIADFTKVEG
ncbi:MAG TPA: glycine--tRNA ligase subunit beta [Paracoccus sp. (in: a-proteobacteria)]|uniref:glycine--tRNA ligase subunit beta n=1 Tax=uncultured Paracoccus sp. TaxID=189685 RepID=UPI00260D5524|nr:glycine--tRNA ligase subunit beta [uncultured Paracoccus sp.]HMQ42644.1 glycine--tRNA ligase subunit beta [Paracoccus sp. (in: a-proteobacteria)]HMR36237.1 glycine--tRNA ligase subunit beta [Paracoccus sp. (in: a-proteobacteria)]